jgi:hypothetical protein
MSYKLYLDDKRVPADSFWDGHLNIYREKDWVETNDLDNFKTTILSKGIPKVISFDFDLGAESQHGNGLQCAEWLVNYCKENNVDFPEYYVHSSWPGIRSKFYKIIGK